MKVVMLERQRGLVAIASSEGKSGGDDLLDDDDEGGHTDDGRVSMG